MSEDSMGTSGNMGGNNNGGEEAPAEEAADVTLSTQGIQATQNINRWAGVASTLSDHPTGSLGEGQSAINYSFKTPGQASGANGFGGYQYAPPSGGQGEMINLMWGQANMGDQKLPTGPLDSGRDAQHPGDMAAADMGPTVPNGHGDPTYVYSYGPEGGARPYTDGTMLGNIGAHMLAKNTWFVADPESAATWGGGTNVGFTAGIQTTLTHANSGADIIRSLQQTEAVTGNGSASGKSRMGYADGAPYGHSRNVTGGFEQIREPILVDMVGLRHIAGMVH